jgi:hypothetical protein
MPTAAFDFWTTGDLAATTTSLWGFLLFDLSFFDFWAWRDTAKKPQITRVNNDL